MAVKRRLPRDLRYAPSPHHRTERATHDTPLPLAWGARGVAVIVRHDGTATWALQEIVKLRTERPDNGKNHRQ